MASSAQAKARLRGVVSDLLAKLGVDDKPDAYERVLSKNINSYYTMSKMKEIEVNRTLRRVAADPSAFTALTKSLGARDRTLVRHFNFVLSEISKDQALKALCSASAPAPASRHGGAPGGGGLLSGSPLVSPAVSMGAADAPSRLGSAAKPSRLQFGGASPAAAARGRAGGSRDDLKIPVPAAAVRRAPENADLVDLAYGSKITLRSVADPALYVSAGSDDRRAVTNRYALEPFLITRDNALNDIGNVRYQDPVCLCSRGRFLAADQKGNVSFATKADARARWTVVPVGGASAVLDQIDASGDVKVFDAVAFRSFTGGFLALAEGGALTMARGNVGRDRQWQISRSGLPFVPDWTRRRPFLLWNPESKLRAGGGPADAMPAVPPSAQNELLLNDVLYALMGIEGQYVKLERRRDGDGDGGGSRSSAGPEWCFRLRAQVADPSTRFVVGRILPLAGYYYDMAQFVRLQTRYEFGLVNHALAACIRDMLKNYLILLTQLETEARRGQMTLQRLWYSLQPSLHALKQLHQAVRRVRGCTGGAVLSALYDGMKREGDAATQAIYTHLLRHASVPFLRMMEQWLHEGVIDDPYDEFQVQSNDDLSKENLHRDYNDQYWELRYTIRPDKIPSFLSEKSLTKRVLVTGKYLNVIRECGLAVANPIEEPIQYSSDLDAYVRVVDRAYAHASRQVLDLLLKKQKLIDRLRSIKRYFLLDQGDFFVHFMNIAKAELRKPVRDIARRKLESLLELAIRTSSANHDPYKDDLSCFLQRYTLMQKLDAIHSTSEAGPAGWNTDPRTMQNPPPAPAAELRGVDAFTLKYQVRWPLSLIISRKTLTKYQQIFRHLFYLKHVEAQLCKAWRGQQSLKELNVRAAFHKSYVLRQKMLHFLQNLVYYMMVEVLEPNWHTMVSRLKAAKSVDEVLYVHDAFLDNCLTQCLLNNQELFKILTKIMTTSLLFAEQIKRTAANIHDNLAKYAEQRDERKRPRRMDGTWRLTKVRTESEHASRMMRQTNYDDMITSFEAKFTRNVGHFIKILRGKSNVHYDHHLANLSTRLDYNGFYTQHFPEVFVDALPPISPLTKKGVGAIY